MVIVDTIDKGEMKSSKIRQKRAEEVVSGDFSPVKVGSGKCPYLSVQPLLFSQRLT